MFSLLINGELCDFAAPVSLLQVLQHHADAHAGGSPGRCAVAVNGDFVPRSQYGLVQLQDGDALDIVSPVGGG